MHVVHHGAFTGVTGSCHQLFISPTRSLLVDCGMFQGADAKGREHHHWVFSSWLAGAGVRAGSIYGESDEHGIRVARNPVHVHDFHATILHLLGFDHERLTYRHSGRDFRLTDVAGQVVPGLLA